MLNDLIALLTPASPVLARALSGPMAPTALRVLGRAVLGDEDAGIDALTEALKTTDPEIKLKLAAATADYLRLAGDIEIERAALENRNAADARDTLINLEAVAASDRASARQRQQITNDRTNAYLAYIVTVGFVLTIVFVALRPPNANPTLQTLLGILGTGWASVMAFFYGSSVGSREKTALLGEASTPPKTTEIPAPQANTAIA